jgi:iron complex transport system substrate-binding protein
VPSTIVALVACLAAVTGCGDDPGDDLGSDAGSDAGQVEEPAVAGPGSDGGDAAFPVVVESAGGEVTIDTRPERIVSLSPTATEILFAIGAGDQVAAVDSLSTYPPEAPVTDLSAYELSLEGIASHEPDLVVLGLDDETVEAGLAGIGVPVLVQTSALVLDDTYDQVAQLGEATGNVDTAAAVNAEIRAGIEELVEARAGDEEVRVYHELDETFFSASSASFIGQLYSLLGYENVADAADPDRTGYPQLQAEQIIGADPTLIVYTDAYGYGDDVIAARPGWDSISAVETGNIVQVDDDIASRWGPRVVELLRLIVEAPVASSSG